MEREAVVESLLRQRGEILGGLGGGGGIQLDPDLPALGEGDHCHRIFGHLLLLGAGPTNTQGERHEGDENDEPHHTPTSSGANRTSISIIAYIRPAAQRRPPRMRSVPPSGRVERLCKRDPTAETSPSSPMSTTARRRWSMRCCGNPASSGPTRRCPSGSWIPSRSSGKRGSRSWPRTRRSATGTSS